MSRTDGFSLVELVVALTLFAMGLLPIAALMTEAARGVHRLERDEWAFWALLSAVDSLEWAGVESPGETVTPVGRVEWSVIASGTPSVVRIRALAAGADSSEARTLVVALPKRESDPTPQASR